MQNFPFEPVSAAALLQAHVAKFGSADAGDTIRQQKIRLGCQDFDDHVLLGGFERASVVGVSTEQESMGLQISVHVLATQLTKEPAQTALVASTLPAPTVARALKDALLALNGPSFPWRGVLQRVAISRVFDVQGLLELLDELDGPRETPPGNRPETPVEQARSAPLLHLSDDDDDEESLQGDERRPVTTARPLSMEIPDSDDDDDGEEGHGQSGAFEYRHGFGRLVQQGEQSSSELSDVSSVPPQEEAQNGAEDEGVPDRALTSSPLSSLSSLSSIEELEDIEHLDTREDDNDSERSEGEAEQEGGEEEEEEAGSSQTQDDTVSKLADSQDHGISQAPTDDGLVPGYYYPSINHLSSSALFQTNPDSTLVPTVTLSDLNAQPPPETTTTTTTMQSIPALETTSPVYSFENAAVGEEEDEEEEQDRESLLAGVGREVVLSELASAEPVQTEPAEAEPVETEPTHSEPTLAEPPQSEPPPNPPSVIVITHFSTLLTSLFANTPSPAAHDTMQSLSRRIRHLSRTLQSAPLVLMTNGTTTAFTPPAASSTAPATMHAPHRSSIAEPTLRSIFSPDPRCPRRKNNRPAFGMSFTQMLDVHLLCTAQPRENDDAQCFARGQPARAVWVVEVLLDDVGVWEGTAGDRRSRDQRWGAIEIQGGRLVDVFPRT